MITIATFKNIVATLSAADIDRIALAGGKIDGKAAFTASVALRQRIEQWRDPISYAPIGMPDHARRRDLDDVRSIAAKRAAEIGLSPALARGLPESAFDAALVLLVNEIEGRVDPRAASLLLDPWIMAGLVPDPSRSNR